MLNHKFQFYNSIKKMSSKNQLIQLISYNAYPVLLKYKPACIINLKADLVKMWDLINDEIISDISLSYYELKRDTSSVTLLLYDYDLVNNAVRTDKISAFFESCGYSRELNVETLLLKLTERFRNDFPHEIGVILGIPLEDVLSFIKFVGKNYIYSGYWKVYNNLPLALATFELYDHAHSIAISKSNL